ncbi:DNA (cytosine-5)-methyltransferase CMT3-like [Zingiber officinale]|uniref:DNA (cytosine-5-)-methyltransferase n=1 Tax=Zingiber officinale TaxID=94328 RepID=A0A8J5KSK2_ZINOF|nr:DNA (cytosine-5)-methyltransferase CMT3-like [Zingiber officinale]KAG6487340.1 hypothetical protein ZIOFF_055926 [Zingiber officinale]
MTAASVEKRDRRVRRAAEASGARATPPSTRSKMRATDAGIDGATAADGSENSARERAAVVGAANEVAPSAPTTRGKKRATNAEEGRAIPVSPIPLPSFTQLSASHLPEMATASAEKRTRRTKLDAEANGARATPPTTRGKKRASEAGKDSAIAADVSTNRVMEASVVVGGANQVEPTDPTTKRKKRVANANGCSARGLDGVKNRVMEIVGEASEVASTDPTLDQSIKKKDICIGDEGYDVASDQTSEEAENQEAEEKELKEVVSIKLSPKKRAGYNKTSKENVVLACHFIGEPIPAAEAKQRWPERYQRKRIYVSGSAKSVDDEPILLARQHYLKAIVDGVTYNLYDDAYVKAGEGEADYIGHIVEFFQATDNQLYFTAQWFFRAEDTVIKEHAHCHGVKVVHDSRRVFLSKETNDNVLDCIVSKIQIKRVTPNIDLEAKEKNIPPCDLYYDMSYSLAYSTFENLSNEHAGTDSGSSSTVSSEDPTNATNQKTPDSEATFGQKNVITLLDLYSGCGAMSTGLCLGASLSDMNLQTCWAVDFNQYACESLKLNHPETQVRNEKANDFLALLNEWVKLCTKYCVLSDQSFDEEESDFNGLDDKEHEDSKPPNGEEFEVENLLDICYGDPNNIGKVGLMFKVRWKGYNPSYDTWEPIDGLSNCEEKIMEFVKSGYKKNILPLPGQVDVICGGPPCQGISGFNRFRNINAPLEDPKNQQMLVFMDIVNFLKPKYVLMENVVDILKFANGFLGRYALSRLVAMNYQARLGMMVAGCYGLPQFRMRAFLWGARPTEILPQFPLPTHDVVVRGGTPNEFEQNIVAYNEDQHPQLEKKLLLEDAISDLPVINNYEDRDEMPYGRPPITEFQKFIRLSRIEALASGSIVERPIAKYPLFDHRPLQLNEDDYQRVCAIPKKKGANFRDLPGVRVGNDNIVEWDPEVERVYLPSGKPLVPDYAMSFIKGKSPKPFGRLWWDETVPTVVTRAEPHNQVILHPEQDRVLSIRENARLQGFPDYYQLRGSIKERYIQVGNAVAVPVARALGYALGQAYQGHRNSEPLLILPRHFPVLDPASATIEAEESG